MTIDEQRLVEIEARAVSAPQPPWRLEFIEGCLGSFADVARVRSGNSDVVISGWCSDYAEGMYMRETAVPLLLHACQDILDLVAEVRSLQQLVSKHHAYGYTQMPLGALCPICAAEAEAQALLEEANR